MKSPVPNGVSTPATRPALLPNDRARRRLGVLPAVIMTVLLVVGLVAACSGSTGTPTTAPTTPPTTASAASSAAATTATPAPPPSDQLQTALTKLKYRCSTELTDPVVQTKCFYADATTFFTVEWQGAAPAVRGFEVTGSALPASKLARSTATALASALGWSSADTKSASASLAKAQQKASRTDKLKLGWGTVVIFAEAYGNNGGHRLTITGTSKADKPVKVKGAMFPGSAKAVAAALKQPD